MNLTLNINYLNKLNIKIYEYIIKNYVSITIVFNLCCFIFTYLILSDI